MFEIIKMFLGSLFSLGLTVFALKKLIVDKQVAYGLTGIVLFIATIIFIGQFVALIGG